MKKIVLTCLLPEEISSSLSLSPSYRGNQIFKWISKGASSFDEMTNLSKELRLSLSEKCVLRSSEITDILKDKDGTVKLQIRTSDGLAVETVLLTDRDGRKTACVSSQAGCAMGCVFCKTGALGLARNLTSGEIVEQFLFLEAECGKLDNIVFMGMGEPLANIPEVVKAVRILTDERGRNLSKKRITVSTCGIVKGIYELLESPVSVRLAFSLTAADEKLRERLMPSGKANSLSEIKKALSLYKEKSGKRITLEAVLLSNVNTSRECAVSLASFANDLDANVNLIPWNKVEELPYEEPSYEEVRKFSSVLENKGVNVTVRMRRGKNISGACGQLGRTSALSFPHGAASQTVLSRLLETS